MNYLNIKKTGNVVGAISAVFFLVCIAWGVVLYDPILKELHFNILLIIYPGFAMSFLGIALGFIEAFIYGWFFGALFAWLCNRACILKGNE